MTDWAFLRRIGRVNIDYRYASDGGFIVNELPELIETPRTMSMSLSPGSDRCPLSDATEIFQGNQRRGVFGFHDKFLRDAMISISRELPRPEGRSFPRHRQNLHHGYVMYWFWFYGRYGLFHPCDEYIPGSIVVSIT